MTALLSPKTIVEFGTSFGASTMVMALNATAARIFTIDLPQDARPELQTTLDAADKEIVRSNRGKVGHLFLGTAVESRIHQIFADSLSLDIVEHTESADFVFIDGGHSYECISADTANADRIARHGTVIIWDDYAWFYPDVPRFLDERARSHQLHRIDGTNLVLEVCTR